MKRLLSLLTCAVFTAVISTASAQHSLRDSTNHYLLLNRERIGSSSNTELVLGTPEKFAGNPIMVEDKPWEARYGTLSSTIIFDPFEKFYKGWFSPWIVWNGSERESAVLYGTSHNGELWNKPLLDLNPWSDQAKTNILVRGPIGASVFRDQRDARQMYKMLYSSGSKLATRTSADGIRWSDEVVAAETTATEDGHTFAFWAPERREYIAMTTIKNGDVRSIGRTISKDFRQWSAVTPVLEGLTDEQQIIALPVMPFGGVFLGFPAIHDNEQDRIQTELAWSADTIHWERIAPGTAFISNGAQGSADWGSAFAGSVIAMNDAVRIFYSGNESTVSGETKGSLHLATLATDRFAGYRAEKETPGVIQLKPLPYRGGTLRLTADIAPGGYVKISAEDKGGTNLIGSTRIEKGGTDIEIPANIPRQTREFSIRLRFQDATVYSLGFR
ncbi:MAG: hypothetical protein ACI9R3_000531 [Verrucomicrobiales bacterium]|jgi:hypothetical protein